MCARVVFFSKRDIFYFKLKAAWYSPLNSYETVVAQHMMSFLLTLKGIIYMCIFAILLLLGTVLLCTT